jgi:hypothetical protein
MSNDVSMVHANIGADLPEVGLKAGNIVSLAWDKQVAQMFVVQWNRTRWWCSCGGGACAHKLAANIYVFEESQKRRMLEKDRTTHSEDEFGLNR